jgi:two-component system, chemotaxis family, chemotaxis protein CheY
MSLGGGTGLRGTMIPTAPGVLSPHQPPSQRSLRLKFQEPSTQFTYNFMKISHHSQRSPTPVPPKPPKDRILLVDDDRQHRACLKEFLEHRGYVCLEAGNGVEGLEVLQEEAVSIIITDTKMPEMGGLDFIERVNHDYAQEVFPIFLITAELSHTVRLRAFKNGVNKVFEKPLDFQELCQAVDWVSKFDIPPSSSTKDTSTK